MRQTIDRYLEDPKSGINTASSQRTYRYNLEAAASTIGKPLAKVTESDLSGWLDSSKVAPATLASRISYLKGFFAWCEDAGLVDRSPAAKLAQRYRVKARPVRRNHWLSADQVRVVLSSTTDDIKGLRDAIVLHLGFGSGLRRQEILDLTWDGIDLDGHQAVLVGKGRKLASVYLSDTTVSLLRQWKALYPHPEGTAPVVVRMQREDSFDGLPARLTPKYGVKGSPNLIYGVIRTASARTGIEFSPHDMRRTFAGLMDDQAGIEKTSAALRHSNLGVTQKYLESRQDAAFQAVKGVDLGF